MERKIIFTTLFFLVVVCGNSQPLSMISGTITDQTTKEPIAYANIGIEGTYTGGASDMSGNFEFKVPTGNTGTYILASAVGYQGLRISISELKDGHLILEMVPTSYDIGVIDVSAQSLVLYRTIRNAIDAIGKNYMKGPLSEKTYYKSETTVNSEAPRINEAIVEISDSKGYQRESAFQVQKHRNYKFLGSRRNYKINGLAEGMNHMDDLLGFDIIRLHGNILDESFLTGYDLSLDKVTHFEGDSAWVINYRLKEPDLSRTGDYYVVSYEGKIYIAKSNYAILKNETWVKASNVSRLGRNFANTGERNWIPVSIGYEFSSIYRKSGNGYNLTYLKCNRHNVWKDNLSGEQRSEITKSLLIPTEINITNPTLLTERTYFTDMPYDAGFWDGYSLIAD